jgi:hypothetical protein
MNTDEERPRSYLEISKVWSSRTIHPDAQARVPRQVRHRGQAAPELLNSEFQVHYNRERPHEAMGNHRLK